MQRQFDPTKGYTVQHKLIQKRFLLCDEAVVRSRCESLIKGRPMTVNNIFLALGWLFDAKEIETIMNRGEWTEYTYAGGDWHKCS